MSCLVNRAADPAAVPAPVADAAAFHASLPGYRPTPVRTLPGVAAELGLDTVAVKDESDRLGLPAFKVLGAAWAVERTLRERPAVHTLVAASAGNHGRAVAHVAALRGLACRIFLPARSADVRRDAIAAEGAEIVVVDGSYEAAVARAAAAGAEDGTAEIADVGASGAARWVIDGYATLFAETAAQVASRRDPRAGRRRLARRRCRALRRRHRRDRGRASSRRPPRASPRRWPPDARRPCRRPGR